MGKENKNNSILLIERINVFLLKQYPKLIVLLIVVVFLISIFLPFLTYLQCKSATVNEINPAIINGILTATAIVFGFVAFELREIKASAVEKCLLSGPLLLFLMFTLETYFIATIRGEINTVLALVATSNCLFNILYFGPVIIAKETHEEIERQKRNS